MHPIERLRMVARAGDDDGELLARETAVALASLASDPAALVMACRRLVQRQPAEGRLWWLCARVLAASDPAEEAYRADDELADDPTPDVLAALLPGGATVEVPGWMPAVRRALRQRRDVRLVRSDPFSSGPVPDLVVVEATALGPGGVVAAEGARRSAASAKDRGVPVWAVAGVGTVLPPELWDAALAALATPAGASSACDVVGVDFLGDVVGPDGPEPFAEALTRPTCPAVPELTRRAPAPGSAVG